MTLFCRNSTLFCRSCVCGIFVSTLKELPRAQEVSSLSQKVKLITAERFKFVIDMEATIVSQTIKTCSLLLDQLFFILLPFSSFLSILCIILRNFTLINILPEIYSNQFGFGYLCVLAGRFTD
ncbi:unnamed protein product [Cuscuta epithymum]|uniref:Uncharacterized protein n=1 Tax=Cuscuta epithymum TaxID=186058 RepID=A0AAV0FDR6_9ASTE|nr:unnamed protein product [Cuscuta epithymum]